MPARTACVRARRTASAIALRSPSGPDRARAPGFFLSSLEDVVGAVRLTVREAQVLRLIARGCTYAQTAERLGMSAHTVGTHIKNDVHSAAAAVMRAIELRLLQA